MESIPLKKHSCGDEEMILGQDMFLCNRPLEYFETHGKKTQTAVRLQLSWVLSGPLPSTSGLFSTCFKAVTQRETDSRLADQIRARYDIEKYEAIRRSARDPQPTHEHLTSSKEPPTRHYVGMIWAEYQISLPKNDSALVQFKSLERRLGKDSILIELFSMTIRDNL